MEGLRRGPGVRKKFQKTLIFLVFEVIVQPPKHTFEIGIFFHVLADCTFIWKDNSYYKIFSSSLLSGLWGSLLVRTDSWTRPLRWPEWIFFCISLEIILWRKSKLLTAITKNAIFQITKCAIFHLIRAIVRPDDEEHWNACVFFCIFQFWVKCLMGWWFYYSDD